MFHNKIFEQVLGTPGQDPFWPLECYVVNKPSNMLKTVMTLLLSYTRVKESE